MNVYVPALFDPGAALKMDASEESRSDTLRKNPFGMEPEAIDQLYGAVPPTTANPVEYCWPAVAVGSGEEVVMKKGVATTGVFVGSFVLGACATTTGAI